MTHAHLKVADIMTKRIITAAKSEMVNHAERRMLESDIRHLPVVDGEGHLIGILSDRDVLRAFEMSRDKAVPISDVMTEDVLTVRPETRACEATQLMLDRRIGALPVVDQEMHVVGVVTETDFLRLAHNVLGGDSIGH
jgi:CBS domain-containing protein